MRWGWGSQLRTSLIYPETRSNLEIRLTQQAAVRKTLSRHLSRQVGSPLYNGATVVEARYYRCVNKGRGSSWGEGAGYHPELPKLVVTAAKKINMTDKCELLV